MNRFLQNKWALSLTAGLFLGLSFPPVNLSLLSFPAFMMLIHLSTICESNRELAKYSYVSFVLWNIIGTYWLTMASAIAGVAAIFANAAIMIIPLIIIRRFLSSLKQPLLISALSAATWVSYEFLHHNWDLSWPWLTLGNAWANQVSLIQYISITGHLGISFWVILTASLAYIAWRSQVRSTALLAIGSLLLFPSISVTMFMLSNDGVDSNSETTRVAVVQPNHDSYQRYGGMSSLNEVMDSLYSITNEIKTEDTELVVWPENAIDANIYTTSRTARQIADSARSWNASVITGAGLYKLYNETPDFYRDTYQGIPRDIYNAALYVDNNGQISRYDKHNLVPVVERFPFVEFLHSIDVLQWFDWGKIAGFGQGYEPSSLNTDSFVTHGLICYDSVYPGWIRNYVNNKADFLTIITNDGWWGNTSGHHQHFAYARLRAIEFDRWVVRSANNGISGIINPKGEVKIKTEYWVRTGFVYDVPKKESLTFYTKFGDWLSYLSLAAMLITLGYLSFRKES